MFKDNTQKQPSFAIHTLGCKVNTYESDAIAESLRRAGFRQRTFSEAADVYIINTCTVTNVADKKSRQMLHRAKKQNPDALVVAAGCYVDAAMQNESMQAVLKDSAVDLLIPNREKAGIAARISEALRERGSLSREAASLVAHGLHEGNTGSIFLSEQGTEADRTAGAKAPDAKAPEALFVTELSGHTRAFVKVQDGCNQFCSYCIIPYVRGRIRSRSIEDCVREITALSENGVREVVLTGIHLSSYGKDFRRAEADAALHGAEEMCAAEEMALSGADAFSDRLPAQAGDDIVNDAHAPLLSLIRAVSGIEGIRRIRLGSLEPRLMTEAFVSALSKVPKLCPHFHLSLQSGCAETLKRMNRHYTPEEYAESCARLRRYFRRPAITTDVIVGFPGETDDAFRESMRFCEEIGFYEMHVFQYSRRAGTRADRMPEQIPEPVKAERSKEMLALADRMSEAYRTSFLGEELCMLCEEPVELSGKLYAVGYSEAYLKCLAPVEEFIQNSELTGKATEICKEKCVYESLLLR